VSKRLGSPYRFGRSNDWLKAKNPDAPAVKREAEEDWGGKRANSDSSWPAYSVPSWPRQFCSAPAQGGAWIFSKSRTIQGAEPSEMRKAVPQGDGRHVGILARTQKLVTHKLQPKGRRAACRMGAGWPPALPRGHRGWFSKLPGTIAGLYRGEHLGKRLIRV
jgi:hypothetical protein